MPQIKLFAEIALRNRVQSTLAQAGAIGVAFGGEDAAAQLLRELE